MDFQAKDKADRDAVRQKDDAARQAKQRLYEALSAIIAEGRKRRNRLFDLKDDSAVKEMDQWAVEAPKKLRALGLPDCAEAVQNPVGGPFVTYSLPPERDNRQFGATVLIQSLEQCRVTHAGE